MSSISCLEGAPSCDEQGMSSVRLHFLSVHSCLFLPGRLNCCSQVNRADRMPPSSVYLYEIGLQNQIAVVTDFCMSELDLLPRGPCCSPVRLDVALWHFQKLNHCQGHSCPFTALRKAWSSYFHKKLGVFSASPFSKAPNLPMVSCFCTLLYAVQTIPKEPKETIIKHLMEKLEMLMLHAWRLENIDTCCDFLVLSTLVFFPTFSVTQYNLYLQRLFLWRRFKESSGYFLLLFC